MFWHLLLGGLAGFLAGKFMRGKGYGLIPDILLGLAGAWIGGLLARHFNIHVHSPEFFITALVGALLLVWLVRLIKR